MAMKMKASAEAHRPSKSRAKRRQREIQALVRSMTQPHYPQMLVSGSECLPWCSPLVTYWYDILIKSVQRGEYPSSGGGTRPRSRADDTREAIPALLHQPTRPSGARGHRVGVPGPPLDESSARASRVGC